MLAAQLCLVRASDQNFRTFSATLFSVDWNGLYISVGKDHNFSKRPMRCGNSVGAGKHPAEWRV